MKAQNEHASQASLVVSSIMQVTLQIVHNSMVYKFKSPDS